VKDKCIMIIQRRQFISAVAASVLSLRPGQAQPHTHPTLDIHVHLFGTGDSGSGCRLSPKITDGLQFRSLKWALGIDKKGKTLDEGYRVALVEMLKTSGLAKAAILGQDAVYDANGQPDWNRTSFYTPNDYVFKFTAQHSDLTVPCPSINPQRRDAIDELERVHTRGARLFKIHPPTQGVDVSDRKHTKFFKKCAELKMIVMVHTGHEHSAPVLDKELANPQRLELALDQGATVIACHCGTGWPSDQSDQLPFFLNLLKHYPNLWGDTAVLGTPGRVRDFYRLLDDPLTKSRLLHGSDFPFPIGPGAFVERIGHETVQEISKETNWLRKDFLLKDALGIGQASAERAYALVLGKMS
jgi:predicted TIM-barrel fold metal-dependent hydrolase